MRKKILQLLWFIPCHVPFYPSVFFVYIDRTRILGHAASGKVEKLILCSHVGSNNHVAYPSWIWYIWNDFVLISCTNETERLSYSKEPSLSLLCTHIMLVESMEPWKSAVLGFIIELLRWIFVSKHERTRCYYIHGLVL